MFQNVRPSNPFYIFDKGENISLKIAEVVSVSNPVQKYPTVYTQPQNMFDTVVDIKVKIGEETIDFKQLPSNLNIANFGNGSVVVSDDSQAMASEIESFISQSENYLQGVGRHENIVKTCPEMLLRLNPRLAKDKENEDRIKNLENSMIDVSQKLSSMMGLMSDFVETKNKQE